MGKYNLIEPPNAQFPFPYTGLEINGDGTFRYFQSTEGRLNFMAFGRWTFSSGKVFFTVVRPPKPMKTRVDVVKSHLDGLGFKRQVNVYNIIEQENIPADTALLTGALIKTALNERMVGYDQGGVVLLDGDERKISIQWLSFSFPYKLSRAEHINSYSFFIRFGFEPTHLELKKLPFRWLEFRGDALYDNEGLSFAKEY